MIWHTTDQCDFKHGLTVNVANTTYGTDVSRKG